MIMVDYGGEGGGGSGRDYIISFFKTEWRQKSVFDKKFFSAYDKSVC